ncbi:MAG: protein kinase domain-containing protein [Planctomycetota bacterium]|jgi:tetratricopeptide (TPR) repeat protein/tRNA A-37 threonylcarbamoyl transferase component Bud32
MVVAIEPGERLGSLVIGRVIGSGSYAEVYLAHDERLHRDVALKHLHARHRDRALDHYLSEARVVAGFSSPHIVTLFRMHEHGEEWLLEMEYVSGGTLKDSIRRGLSMEQAELIFRGLATGLGVAHKAGVLHRDLKPANVLVTPEGTPKLTDFGLARVRGEANLDVGEELVGTPIYMAPEALLGEEATEQSDIWGLGVIAYEMLTGQLPFPINTPAEFFACVQNTPPTPLPPVVNARLKETIARCLEKAPDARPQSTDELLEILDRPVTSFVAEPAPRAAPRLLGRDAEATRLQQALEHARKRARTIELVGAPGIGKSTLLADTGRRAYELGFFVVPVRLSSVEGPLASLLQAAHTGALQSSTRGSTAFGSSQPLLRSLLAGEAPPAMQDRQQVLWALTQLLGGMAAERPLALLIDDAQYATDEDISLLSDLATRLSDRPFLMMLSTRPGSPATMLFKPDERMELGGLSSESIFALLEQEMDARMPPRAIRRIAERSEGHPLRAIELTRHLVESGALDRANGSLVLTASWNEDAIPRRLRDVVNARLDKLDEEDRALLEMAAVDGRDFDGSALAAVMEQPALQVLRRLQRLCRDRTLLEPGDPGYRFADRSVHEVLYDDLAPEFRVALHKKFAEHLETRDDPIPPARLARHWEGSREKARAAPFLIVMAEAAADRQEVARAIDLARRAGLLDDPTPIDLAAHADLVTALCDGLAGHGDKEEAWSLYDRLQEAVRATGDELAAERIVVRRSLVEVRFAAPLSVTESELERIADRLGKEVDGGTARIVLGIVAKRHGDFDRAREQFEAALRVFEASGEPTRCSAALGQLGAVALRSGHYSDAQDYYKKAAGFAERAGLLASAAVSRVNRAASALAGGTVDGVVEDLESALRTFELSGIWVYAGQGRVLLAEAHYALGDQHAALRELDEGIAVMERVESRFGLAHAYRLRGILRAQGGDLEGGSEDIERACAAATEAGDVAQHATALAVRALIATWEEEPGRARAAAEAALRRAKETDQSLDEVVSTLAEAALFGLPRDLLKEARSIPVGDAGDHARALLAAAQVFSDPEGSGQELQRHAQSILGAQIGARAAHMRLLGHWMATEAAHRSGAKPKDAAAAIDAAAALNHIWVRRAL